MFDEIEFLRKQMHEAYEKGLPLTDVRMIHISQDLDKLLTLYHVIHNSESKSFHLNLLTGINVITLGGDDSHM
ncbi:aspartyl-phosphate phosphatase Spo0E family protein [Paenibacillus sp. CAU 1523]|uniref:Aspartyl-phosphate phosphatase Spo0E family protein n=2 Tax=Paenibacillus arenosi TaxID=2774142 RepID=A0ABR9B2B7_9BACL|nr:aspartyl-phosphate phosphatase Spo0E family protein [Paenibacillus arenosi]